MFIISAKLNKQNIYVQIFFLIISKKLKLEYIYDKMTYKLKNEKRRKNVIK